MSELGERLERLGAEARWPATADLAAAVRAAIEAAPAQRRRRRRRPRLLVGLLALVAGGALAAPVVGSELLERLGLKGARVTQVRELPPAPLGRPLALGTRHTLTDARRLAGRPLVRPAALGTPAEVYLDGDAVTFVYRARSGRPILFMQVPGSAGQYVSKLVVRRARQVRIGAGAGLLMRGRHTVVFAPHGGGAPVLSELRLAKNTVLWERAGLLLRLEAEQPADELLRIARSVG